jgi:D-alanyl-lipoteichoic acid acyltransferase DltB (MBOAT superfamily)
MVGLRWEVPNLDVLLPVGISFYTFQAIGYTIDVYRGDVNHEKSFGIYALFVSFFPQLVAGPIERTKSLLPQFKKEIFFDIRNITEGLKLMLWGFFLKLAMADNLAEYVNAVYNNIEQHSSSTIALASFYFSFQIYGDFAGYSLIAVGVAKCLGFTLMSNFERPYFAPNITVFWSRWHISLSTWFKDYLYIPMGGNRKGKLRNYYNLFFTFLVSGIWHGANFTFLIWGAMHGFFVVIEKLLNFKRPKYNKFSFLYIIKTVFTFLLVSTAWVFFRANSLSDAFYVFKKLFYDVDFKLFINAEIFAISALVLFVVFVKDFGDEFLSKKFSMLDNPNIFIRYLSISIMFILILLVGTFDNAQFIYFQF